MSDETRDNIEVRLHKDGTLDEIVTYDDEGCCLFHMEQMDDHWFWMRFYGVTQDLVVHIGAVTGEVRAGTFSEGTLLEEKVQGPKISVDYNWDDPAVESECHPDYATPDAERKKQIGDLLNKYGPAIVLEQIAEIYEQGRKAEHETNLINSLRKTKEEFIVQEKVYWERELQRSD